AIKFEVDRQVRTLEAGGRIRQETRAYDADAGTTRLLRSKEEAHDYRYFSEPDLPALVLAPERLEALRESLPELPWERRRRFAGQYGLPAEQARVLTAGRAIADYFEAAAAALPANPRGIANWVSGEVLRELKEGKSECPALSAERLADLVRLVDAGKLSTSAAKEVFAALWGTAEEPEAAAERLGLIQVSDTAQIAAWVDAVIAAHEGPVGQYRSG